MTRFLQIYLAFIKQQIKTLLEYRADFVAGIVGMIIQQIATFLMLFTVFTQIRSIGGYSFDEILLFYGYSMTIRGIDHVYNDNIWDVAWNRIRDGRFAQYLIRPLNPLTHIVMEKIQFDGVGGTVVGILIFFYAKGRLGLVFGWKEWGVLMVFLLTGLMIFFAIKLLCTAVAFWTVSSGELMTLAYEMNSFTRYPLDIYKNFLLRFMLIYVIPFAVVSYLPVTYFIRDSKAISEVIGISYQHGDLLVLLVVGIAVVTLAMSLFLWSLGLRRYEATGT